MDNNLTGTAGMTRKIHIYKATDGTEKLKMGEGNTKTIDRWLHREGIQDPSGTEPVCSTIDEEAMTDPMVDDYRHPPCGNRSVQHRRTPIFTPLSMMPP